MKAFAKKRVRAVKTYQPGRPIEDVKRELGLKRVIKLASNETPYGPSPKVLDAIAKAAKKLNRYPDGQCYDLRQALARRLGVDDKQLIFGNGSDEVIVMAVRAFAGPGDEVVIAKPSFLIYDIASRLEGAAVKAVPLKDFMYDCAAMAKAITPRTKMVFIGNPDNPAGTYLPQTELVAFLKKIPARVLVLLDEAYFEYVDRPDYPDGVTLLKDFPNCVVTRTFSKMYGLAGLRIGYGVAHADVIDILNKVREPFNVNSIAQAAAAACLKDRAYYRGVAKKIKAQRRFLYDGLGRLGCTFRESWTNFILIDVGDGSKVAGELMKRGVIVRDMAVWGLDRMIRVSIGTAAENRIFLKALGEVLGKK